MSVKYTKDPVILELYARLRDLCAASERGELTASPFLTPREAMYAKSYLEPRLREGSACFAGGYAHAERVRALILPDYAAGFVSSEDMASDPVAALTSVGLCELAEGIARYVSVLSVKGSGYRTLTHRDYLGSVLGLGLERDVIGDILVVNEHSAYLVCKGEISDFLAANLTHVASDTVKTERLSPGVPLLVEKRRQPVHDTVASPRLDCVVAALGNLSRDKAQTAVSSGLVELNYEVCEACDAMVESPCILSIRGIGKFEVIAIGGETRKGRLRLAAEKYI